MTQKITDSSPSPESLHIGDPAPDFALPAAGGETVRLSQFRGRKVLLYFYPKDSTPGCTQEACDFRDRYEAIADRNAVVLGISPDSPKSHARFAEKNSLPFPLLSDEDHRVSESYGVWQLKKLYGREFMGIVRSTFLIGEDGTVQKIWRKVKVKGHAEDAAAGL
ncbi:thioredoxin-dependent thiol peroxidase [Paenibacillus glufosinatiresistens]|uniref:thioredoxin-dependent thiol peroxidase n=1 Tax=Paenibacillus glufosinatiresistens TaxID=3070657 RepID=UPI00286DAF4E|nr:thioredoxin-dependent thiol peroxidase [Paenibacillus sp. YX.27]